MRALAAERVNIVDIDHDMTPLTGARNSNDQSHLTVVQKSHGCGSGRVHVRTNVYLISALGSGDVR